MSAPPHKAGLIPGAWRPNMGIGFEARIDAEILQQPSLFRRGGQFLIGQMDQIHKMNRISEITSVGVSRQKSCIQRKAL